MKTTTKERPLILSAESVRAVLEGRKTQTRRVVKPEPFQFEGHWAYFKRGICKPFWTKADIATGATEVVYPTEQELIEKFLRCPYGKPGDRLWVRETFRLRADQDDKPPSQDWWKSGAWYEANGNCEPSGCAGGAGRPRSPIHMPRWASRLTLEVEAVRVERLQDINSQECHLEGIRLQPEQPRTAEELRRTFAEAWDALNADRGYSWASNPWIWVVTFRRVEQPSAEFARLKGQGASGP